MTAIDMIASLASIQLKDLATAKAGLNACETPKWHIYLAARLVRELTPPNLWFRYIDGHGRFCDGQSFAKGRSHGSVGLSDRNLGEQDRKTTSAQHALEQWSA
jgi:hypothetical protein